MTSANVPTPSAFSRKNSALSQHLVITSGSHAAAGSNFVCDGLTKSFGSSISSLACQALQRSAWYNCKLTLCDSSGVCQTTRQYSLRFTAWTVFATAAHGSMDLFSKGCPTAISGLCRAQALKLCYKEPLHGFSVYARKLCPATCLSLANRHTCPKQLQRTNKLRLE